MGLAGSPDIFQSKMSELMAALEFVRTYLDDILIISKDDMYDYLNNGIHQVARCTVKN